MQILVVTDVAQLVVFNATEHINQVLVEQAAKHAEAFIREDTLPIVLNLADYACRMSGLRVSRSQCQPGQPWGKNSGYFTRAVQRC